VERELRNSVTTISEGVHRLRFELPLDVQPLNIYLLEGDPLTLIDAGPILEGVAEAIPRAIERAGFPPRSLGRIIITHHHPDHLGMAARLKAGSGAEVVCHRLASRTLTDYWGESDRYDQFMRQILPYAGVDRNALDSARAPGAIDWKQVAEPVEVDTVVEDGDSLEGKPHGLSVIHTPGHTIDHVCLYQEDLGLLFSGDMLLNSITPNPDIYPPWQSEQRSGLPDYIRSLGKLRDLKASLALPGHGARIEDVRARVDDVLVHHEERLVFLLGALVEEMTVLKLALVLLAHIGYEPARDNVFLAMREVFGHLEILEARGKINRVMRGDTAYYRAAKV
jgi:glyoxylase-like metal-dependent hydrolase (beta-lactamase superfamily II)